MKYTKRENIIELVAKINKNVLTQLLKYIIMQ